MATTDPAPALLDDSTGAVYLDALTIDPEPITTLAQYNAEFATLRGAVAFEDSVLNSGRDLLPDCALAVLDDPDADPAPEYWAFLAEQLAGSTR